MITIIIPTYNRSDFLARLLAYYAERKYEQWLSIGDSSVGEHLANGRKLAGKYKGRLKIRYHEYPGLTEPQTTDQLLKSIETPYMAWVADDDFIVPSGLESCADFLAANPDYSVAFGRSILINTGSSGPHGEIQGLSSYALRPIEDELAGDRIVNHLNDYSNNNFGVHRTEQFRKAYAKVTDLTDKGYTELMPNCLSTIEGKIKALDNFYLVRQTHDRRYFLPTLFDWLTGPNWQASYRIFFDACSRALSDKDGIPREEAQEIMKKAFWSYLKNGLNRKFVNYFLPDRDLGLGERIKSKLKRNKMIYEKLAPIFRRVKPEIARIKEDPDYTAVYRAVKLPSGEN